MTQLIRYEMLVSRFAYNYSIDIARIISGGALFLSSKVDLF